MSRPSGFHSFCLQQNHLILTVTTGIRYAFRLPDSCVRCGLTLRAAPGLRHRSNYGALNEHVTLILMQVQLAGADRALMSTINQVHGSFCGLQESFQAFVILSLRWGRRVSGWVGGRQGMESVPCVLGIGSSRSPAPSVLMGRTWKAGSAAVFL